ncbi:MAG: carbohydrate ABC transporter permease [Oscillospiraceae bacterium]|nr:carbohydrate ABC transporter permease [Oscillospiraceae bacterium]
MADSYNFSNTEYRRKLRIHSVIRLIVCILLTVISLLPIYIILINATRANADIISNGISFLPGTNIIENFKNMTDPSYANGVYYRIFNVLVGYRNSLFISISATILTVFFSAMTAYGLSVYDFKGKKFATTFILLVMMVPSQVVSTGFLEFMASLKLLNNYIPLIIPAIAAPATVFFMLQYMKSSFPLDIVEAARIDGCSEFRTFMQISLPIFKPAFAVQAIFAFVANWNNYYTPTMILVNGDSSMKTMPMMVAGVMGISTSTDYGIQNLAVVLSIIPIIVIYLALSKFIVKGVALGAVKG